MAAKNKLLQELGLRGLSIAPSQVRGAIRIVPLLRKNVRYDLRLERRAYNEDLTIVSLEGQMLEEGMKYISYVPHGLVLSWSNDGSAIAAMGAQMKEGQMKSDAQSSRNEGKKFASARVLHRMAKREDKNRLRFLPLHLAMEGFLASFFSGPSIAWSEYSQEALSHGLGSRWEMSFGGRAISGFEDALRVFEIHEKQVGVLVFVAEALASAFVLPTPEDYRALHQSLLEDFYGELIFQYALMYDTNYPMDVSVDEELINNVADLREAVEKMRMHWAEFQGFMAANLLQRPLQNKRVYTAGRFLLQRFMTDLDPKQENHIGEAIARDSGEIEYLKTYRLSAAQTKRVYLLSKLSESDWNLEATASKLFTSKDELVIRLERAGFGYLLKQNLLEIAQKNRKKRRRN
ncbi:MAG: hypothetical protein F6J93_03370 [Oscillatoria sp. SIO1A7]|nr:hypothetical protein [Oscillatoria sp. SIO1A7]